MYGNFSINMKGMIKKILEETEGVKEAVVSHTDGTAIVKMSDCVSDDILSKIITDNGYKVIEIK